VSFKRDSASGLGWIRWSIGWLATPLVNRLFDRGKSLIHEDRPEIAERRLRLARHLDPYSIPLIGQHAIALSDCGDYESAESAFRWMTEQSPEDPISWANLGESISRQRRYAEALAAFEKAESLGMQGLSSGYYSIGAKMLEDNRCQEAVPVYQHTVELDPDDGQAWTNLSFALINSNQAASAEQAARRAVSLIPDDDLAWCNLGQALEALGQFEEALSAYDKSVEVYPDHILDCSHAADLRARLAQDNS